MYVSANVWTFDTFRKDSSTAKSPLKLYWATASPYSKTWMEGTLMGLGISVGGRTCVEKGSNITTGLWL